MEEISSRDYTGELGRILSASYAEVWNCSTSLRKELHDIDDYCIELDSINLFPSRHD
jgi:hypothetical protein